MHACSSKDYILDHELPAHEEDGSSRASDIDINGISTNANFSPGCVLCS